MAKKKQELAVEIPVIEFGILAIEIVGATPLLTARFGKKQQKMIEDKQQGKASVKKAPRVPEEEYREKIYFLEPGPNGEERYGFPSRGVKKAMVNAGGRFTDGVMTKYRGMFGIMEEMLEIITPHPPRLRSDVVRLQRNITSIAYRPEFEPWSMVVPVKYMKHQILPDQVINLLSLAGFTVGIGEWTPAHNGIHGQFEIGNVEYIDL